MEPWEQYKKEQVADSLPPWEKFKGETEDLPIDSKTLLQRMEDEAAKMQTVSPEAAALLGEVREQNNPEIAYAEHPEFPGGLRWGFKNLTDNSSDEAFNLLQQKAPQFNFKKDKKGNILLKKPEEAKWSYLDDPNKFTLEDVSDVALDIPAGLLEAGATVAGGIAGAATPIPGGALLGAGMAGAGAGALTESVRQGLANYFGFRDNYDPDAIKSSAMISGAAPFLFGTGAGVKQIAKALPNASKEAIEQMAKSQSGIPMRGVQYGKENILPQIGGMISGESPETLKHVAKNLSRIDQAEIKGDYVKILEDLSQNAQTAQTRYTSEVGEQYGKALEKVNATVDVAEAEKPLKELVEKYEFKKDRILKDLLDSGLSLEEAEKLASKKVEYENYQYVKDMYDKYASTKKQLYGPEIKAHIDRLNDITQVRKSGNISAKEIVDQDLIKASKQVAGDLNKRLTSGSAENEAFGEIKTKYNQALKQNKTIKKHFEDPEKVEKTITKLSSPGSKAVKKKVLGVSENLGINLEDSAKDIMAMRKFAAPAKDPISSMGVTSTSRTIPLSLAGGATGYYVGQQSDASPFLSATVGGLFGAKAGSPWALKQYMKLGNKASDIAQIPYRMGPAALPQLPQTGTSLWKNMSQSQYPQENK